MPRLKITSLIMLFAFISVSVSNQVVTHAQDANTCENLLVQAIQSVQDICSNLEPGNACTPSGDTIALDDMDTLETSVLNLEANQWDSALIKIATSGQPIAMALFGGAQVTYSAPETAVPTEQPLTVSNKSGYNVNLRQGPGKDFELAGFFGWDKTSTVDGRSADNDWLRLQTDDGFAWIASDLVSLQGDINNLPVLSGDASPMQQFTLRTPDESADCGAGAAGLLVSRTGSDNVGLQVNGTNLTFDTATLLLQAKPNANLEIYVIEGETAVDADGEHITAQEGETAEIALGGINGLQAAAAPLVKPSYPFTTMIGIPLLLVSDESLACTAGLSDDIATVSLFEQPNNDAAITGLLLLDAHYTVSGMVTDDQGNNWWKLDQGYVRQDTVQVTGACDVVAEISGTSSVVSADNMSTNTGATSTMFASDIVPVGDTIWSADPGQDILSGTCLMPPLPVCPHPVAITPNGGTLSWRGQEPLPYTLRLTGDNAYSFSGRNNLNNADVNMSLTFTSATTWMMTTTQVFDNDSACVHTLYYNAVPR